MRTGVTVDLSPTDRKRLQAIVDDRNSPQNHVWRAWIVLATADGLGTSAIMRTAGVSKTAVWHWQQRFMTEGIDGLLRDKSRPARIAKLADDVAEQIVALTLAEPSGETTHWTGRVMAKVAGVSLTSIQRIWKAHGLARIASAFSSRPTIQDLWQKSATSSAPMSIRPPTPWCSASMRNRRSRPQGRCRSPGRHQPLRHRPQPAAQTLRLDRRPRQNHRRRYPRAPNVGFNPLGRRPGELTDLREK